MTEEDDWTNPAHPPVDASDLGENVWVTWNSPYNRTPDQPMIWHWCTGERWEAGPRWGVAGVGAHELISRDPLHLEPSILWPDCCGMHGFIRDGRWIPA